MADVGDIGEELSRFGNQRVVGKENPCRDKARSEALVMLIRTVGRRIALPIWDVRNLHLSLKGSMQVLCQVSRDFKRHLGLNFWTVFLTHVR